MHVAGGVERATACGGAGGQSVELWPAQAHPPGQGFQLPPAAAPAPRDRQATGGRIFSLARVPSL